MEDHEVINVPDGDELFTEEVPPVFLTEGQEMDKPWVDFSVEVKPTGGKDARNKKKE